MSADAPDAADAAAAPPSYDPARWAGVARPYSPAAVARLRGSVAVAHTLAARGAEALWRLLTEEAYVPALGALSGNQAVQMAKAGLKAIYLSGWQVAAESNSAGQTYPDQVRAAPPLDRTVNQGKSNPKMNRPTHEPTNKPTIHPTNQPQPQSLYPVNSVPLLVKRINNALRRADQIESAEAGAPSRDYFLPIVADAEAGFGGPLNAYELAGALIEAGAAAVHFEDQLSSEKKCGHLGGKVLIPAAAAVRNLVAARLAADVAGVPTIIIGRTDAHSARLVTSDVDARDRPFLTGERTPEGFFGVRCGVELAVARGLAYAPYADLIWCETSTPDLEDARAFAAGIHAQFPGKMLAYNCSPSFNWRKNLSEAEIADFQRALGALGYRFQFVTLAGAPAVSLFFIFYIECLHLFFALSNPPALPFFPTSRLPRAQLLDVRARGRLPRARDERLLGAAGQGVCRRGGGLHRRASPARGRDRLLRRRVGRDYRRRELDDRARRLDRGRAVLRSYFKAR
jgi:isocitrate lyase